jgi:hypothetical protein
LALQRPLAFPFLPSARAQRHWAYWTDDQWLQMFRICQSF